MRRPIVLLFALALLAPLDAASAPRRRSNPVRYGHALVPGDPAPAVTGTSLDGTEVTLSYADGKLSIVNFWATWCVPCREEMPALEKLAKTHGKKLQVIGALAVDPAPPEDINAAVIASGVSYKIVAVPDGTMATWGGVTLIPTTFLVDGQGKLVRKFVGTDEAGMKALSRDVADFLAGRPLKDPYVPPSVPEAAPVR